MSVGLTLVRKEITEERIALGNTLRDAGSGVIIL